MRFEYFNKPMTREQKAIKGILKNNDPMMFSQRTLYAMYKNNKMVGYCEDYVAKPKKDHIKLIKRKIKAKLYTKIDGNVYNFNFKAAT